jgi:outer membrane protein assembly factor BamB
MSAARAAATALVAVALAGCWPAPGQGPDRRAHNPREAAVTTATVADLAPLWRADLPTWPYADAGTPVVSSRAVLVSDAYGLHALDPTTGEPLWREPGGEAYILPVVADPIVEGNRVLYSWGTAVGEAGHWVFDGAWLDTATGTRGDDVPAGPVTAWRGGRAATYTLFGGLPPYQVRELVVVDTGDPGASWRSVVQFPDLGAPQPPTLGAHRLYHVGTIDTTYDTVARVTGVRAYPLASPTVCAGRHPQFPAVGPMMCRLWEVPTASAPVTSPVVGPGESAVHVGLADGTALALDAATGTELWATPLGAAPSADPALADGSLYVPLADGDLAVLDAATGAVTWRADVGGAGRQPAVAGRATPGATGVVFVGTAAGDLVALPAAGCGAPTCTPVWSHDLGSAVTGAPTVSGGRVHVGTGRPARVTAFALAAPDG